jgi:N-acetylglucosaminyldiphosphoundecaprenol N-acetyl-beta-D-mannosaminyltransferase
MNANPQPREAARPPIAILGVPFGNVTTEMTLGLIEGMIASRQPHYLVTANVDFVVQARQDVELRRILMDAHLVVADGMPLVWASRWLGNPLPERVTGSGLTPRLLARAEAKGWRVFFLGGTEASVAQAAANTRAKHPRLQLVGAYSPPFKPLIDMDHEDILRRLREAQPDILLVAFGCPKQEKWLNMRYRAAGVPVGIGVGATIDFLAGTMKRAPLWMQRTGLEWVFRLLQEPRRLFRRYFTDLWVFGWALLRQLREMRAGREAVPGAAPVEIATTPDPNAILVRLPSRLTVEVVAAHDAVWKQLADRSADVLLGVGELNVVDSTGLALLVRLQKTLREQGRHLVLVAPGRVLIRVLGLMKLSDFFTLAPDVPQALVVVADRRREKSVSTAPSPTGCSARIVWQGEITAANVAEVARATESWRAQTPGGGVIDLSGVRFIDSSGIGLMVRLRKQAREKKVDLAFVGATENVRNVARLLRLEDFLFGTKP